MNKPMTRREFMKSLGVMSAAVSITQFSNPVIAKALKEVTEKSPPILWMAGGTCGGCSISALNAVAPTIDKILLNLVTVHYHINLSAASGDKVFDHIYKVMEEEKGNYIYIQEGTIPTAFDGRLCVAANYKGKDVTMLELAQQLAANAKVVIAAGACPSFGGIPSAPPNPTEIKPLSQLVDKQVINIPGCPVHPDDLFGSLIYYLKHGMPPLDEHNRPKPFFSSTIHSECHLKPAFDNDDFAENWGEPDKCYAMLGCSGPNTHCDAWKRGWNGNMNWCIKGGSHCIGCTEPDFAKTRSGLYS